MEIIFAPDYKARFKDALHLMPQWKLTVTVTVKYLWNIDAPFTKWKMNYTTVTETATTYDLTESSRQKLVALSDGETAVLLRNFFVEQ